MKLRLTGEYPDLECLAQYPNWEYALDEEGVDGQDESTIRPAANQRTIDEEVAFTAGFATLADGRKLYAILQLQDGRIGGFTVYENDAWGWSVRKLGNPSRWTSIDFSWVDAESRPPSVELDDPNVFPLRLETALRNQNGVSILSTQI